jgi:hypothetical protein
VYAILRAVGESITMSKRRVQIDKNLFFEYEVSPHRAILARISNVSAGRLNRTTPASEKLEGVPQRTACEASLRLNSKTGMHIPFKQVRLKGQINPLKPPLHVETVLIGRALGQPTGYLAGVGFRIRDDGYVEGEFEHGAEKFLSFEDFEKAVKICLKQISDSND